MRTAGDYSSRKSVVEALKAFYRLWLKVAHAIGRVNTAILLSLFYFLFLGAAKLVTVLAHKDLLDQKWRDRPTYWRKRQDFRTVREEFLKPY